LLIGRQRVTRSASWPLYSIELPITIKFEKDTDKLGIRRKNPGFQNIRERKKLRKRKKIKERKKLRKRNKIRERKKIREKKCHSS